MRKLFYTLAFLVCATVPSRAQFAPANSNAVFYFAHFADGGPAGDQWKTVIRIVNSGAVPLDASGRLWFYDPHGQPIALDFGSGPETSLDVTIPWGGSVELRSANANSALQTGSIWATFDTQVSGVEEFQNWRNGVFVSAASVPASGGTLAFETYADSYTGIAVANPSLEELDCIGTFTASDGSDMGTNKFSLVARGQTSFTLGPTLNQASVTAGSYFLSCTIPTSSNPAAFAALALAGDANGITSSMPSGDFALPRDPFPLVWNAFFPMVTALNSVPGFEVGNPKIQIYGDQVLNAFFDSNTNTVGIEAGLVELMADSPSEVAAIVAHELGHAHQYYTGRLDFNSNPELDADEFSLAALLLTGYDPYAAGGALGKLGMVTEDTSLAAQNFDNILAATGVDPHTSFTNRMGNIMNEINALCSLPEAQQFCPAEHAIFHPYLPAPLRHAPRLTAPVK